MIRRAWVLRAVLALLALSPVACSGRRDPMERIRSRGALRVAVDPSYPPFEMRDGNGNLVGLDVDLAREIGRRLGVPVTFVEASYEQLDAVLASDRADVIISAFYPKSQTDGLVFSDAYFDAGEVVVVPKDSPIQGVDDLAGRVIIVVFGSAGHNAVLHWQQTLNPPPKEPQRADLPQVAVSFLAAHPDMVDAAIADNITAQIALRVYGNLRVLDVKISEEPYVIATLSKNASLIQVINPILSELKRDGTLERLEDTWFGAGFSSSRPAPRPWFGFASEVGVER